MRGRAARAGAITTAALLVILCFGGRAIARESYWVRVGLQPTFGFAGEGEGKMGGGFRNFINKVEDDFEPMAGFTLFGEFRIHRYFALGPSVSFLFWNVEFFDDNDIKPSMFIDFDVSLRVLYPLVNDKLEIYARVPVGLTLSVLNSDFEDYGLDADPGVGANFSFVVGVLYNVWSQLDIFLEMGAVYHWVKNDGKFRGAKGDAELSGAQMAFNFGAAWRF